MPKLDRAEIERLIGMMNWTRAPLNDLSFLARLGEWFRVNSAALLELADGVRVPRDRLVQLRVRIAENCTNIEALATIDTMLAAANREGE